MRRRCGAASRGGVSGGRRRSFGCIWVCFRGMKWLRNSRLLWTAAIALARVVHGAFGRLEGASATTRNTRLGVCKASNMCTSCTLSRVLSCSML